MRPLANRLTCLAILAYGSAHAATFPSAFEPLRMSAGEGLVFSGSGENSSFGLQAVALGDIDGDGLADIALGTESDSDGAGIYILHGSPGLVSMRLTPDTIASAGGTYLPGRNQISAIGDFNGDGLDDLAVFSRTEDVDDRSTISVVLGVPGALPATLDLTTVPDAWRATTRFAYEYDGTNYLWSGFYGGQYASVDVNADGFDDLLLGSPGAYAPGTDIDALIDDPDSNSLDSQRTGLAYVVFGRRDTGAPASPWNAYPAFSRDAIDLRWELAAGENAAGFEILSEGRVLGSPGADDRSFEIANAPRFDRQTYELVTLSPAGDRSAPLVLSANNDVATFPEVGGEVYSDALAEIFWVFDNREYDVYRDGVWVDRLWAQSWLDDDYDPGGHIYRIETVNRSSQDRVLRSTPLALPAEAGTRPPAPVTGLDFAVYSATTLELFWKRAERGTPPLSYEVSRYGEPAITTSGNSLMDYGIERYGSYQYRVVTIDGNGRRSLPTRVDVFL